MVFFQYPMHESAQQGLAKLVIVPRTIREEVGEHCLIHGVQDQAIELGNGFSALTGQQGLDEVHEMLLLRFTQAQLEQPQKAGDGLRWRYDLQHVEASGIGFFDNKIQYLEASTPKSHRAIFAKLQLNYSKNH